MTSRSKHVAKIVAVVMLTAQVGIAQDPVVVAPHHYKVLLENNRVRVLEALLKPGEKTPMHSHPARVIYVLSDHKSTFRFPDGRTVNGASKAGEVAWRESTTHSEENTGTTDDRAIIVELKDSVH